MSYNFVAFLKNIIDSRIDEVYQGIIGKVETFDQQKMRADVTLQLQSENEESEKFDFGKIQNVPVGFIYGGGGYYIRPYYIFGDLVWITFSSRGIRNALKGFLLPESKEKFSLSFAMLSHGLTPETFTPPTSWADNGLLIGKDDTYISVTDTAIKAQNSSGDFELKSSGQVAINGTNLTVDA